MPSPEDMKAVEGGCSNIQIFIRRRRAHHQASSGNTGMERGKLLLVKLLGMSLEPLGSCLEALYFEKRFWSPVLSETIQVSPDHGQRVSFRARGISWPGLVACCAAGALLMVPG